MELARDGVAFRRLGAGESLAFEDVREGLRLSGAYGAHEPSLAMFAETPGSSERLAGTCVQDSCDTPSVEQPAAPASRAS